MNKTFINTLLATSASFVCAATAVAAASAGEDIRDIRGPLTIPSSGQWGTYAAMAALGIALVVVAWQIYRWRANRSKTAYQLAKQRLHAAAALIAPGQGGALVDAVSDAVRAYIEARFAVRAAHKTTEEFLTDLLMDTTAAPALLPHRNDLARLLSQSDLVKFAGLTISAEQMHVLHKLATGFVDRAHEAQMELRKQTRKGAVASTQTNGATT